MANPLYQQHMNQQQMNNGNMIQNFSQFMNQHRGENPYPMINQFISSGKISQAQLNQIQMRAQQIEGTLSGIRSMFGF